MISKRFKIEYITVITIILGIVLVLSPLKVMADDATANPSLTLSYDSADGANIMSYVNSVNNYVSSFDLLDFNAEGSNNTMGTLTINLTSYKNLSQNRKTEIMSYALDKIKNSNMSTVSRNKIYNFIQSQDASTASLVRQLSNDVNADFGEAYMLFKPFSGVLGTILGVFTIVIFVTLTLMILCDLSYIVIPMIRDALTPDTADAKPKYISNEAWYAVKEVDGSQGEKKDVLLLYFKKKSIQFVALSICILYLLSGQIYILIGNLMDMFRGVLG